MSDVRGLVVVVPVHDEEERLGACLSSVRRALGHPSVRSLPAVVVVVLDACGDRSAEVADRHLRAGDVVVRADAGNVGVARATGTRVGLERLGLDPDLVWTAHTDADSAVPRRWLARQVSLARAFDAVAGVVRVDDWSGHLPATRRRYERAYRGRAFGPHPHVHGATLGVRASVYLDVGGFPPLASGEDHALWEAVRASGRPVVATRRVWVTTSGRRVGRARGGFADTLLAIEGQVRHAALEPAPLPNL